MKRQTKDIITNVLTYLFSSVGVIILASILIFIFSKGWKTLNLKMLFSDYNAKTYSARLDDNSFSLGDFSQPKGELYFSSKWGIGLSNDKNDSKEKIVIVSYIAKNSPLRNLKSNVETNDYISLKANYSIEKISFLDEDNNIISAFGSYGAQEMINAFEEGEKINNIVLTSSGGGIRGSLITTGYLIILTLLFALPLGIGGAIYLHEYAKNNRFTRIIRGLIDMTSGIPSIIFGFIGMLVFIPFMDKAIGSDGGSIASGALTMAIILLPTIIKTTEEALIVIPDSYRNASLALGASKTQTIFKVVIPNALGGILTSIILSIGRIIGESAALVYAIGTSIKDSVFINERSTTLAVHIWTIMGGENPNYEQACSISIIILLIVLLLNSFVKVIGKKLNKFEVKE